MEGTLEKNQNEENEWDRMVETDLVEGPVEKAARNEIVEAIQSMKSRKATGPSEVSVEMIVASGEIEVKVMMELCQRVLDGRGMPDEWKTSVIVSIFFFYFICHIYPPFTRKRCIAMFWTVSPHSLGYCHFRVTCLPHKGGASR